MTTDCRNFKLHRLLFTTTVVLSILCACTEAARWKKVPERMNPREGFSVMRPLMEHDAALNMSRMIGGDHPLRNDLFSTLNRRRLASCSNLYPNASIQVDATGPLADVQTVTVTVSGMTDPSDHHWVAVVSPSNSRSVLKFVKLHVFFQFCAFQWKLWKFWGLVWLIGCVEFVFSTNTCLGNEALYVQTGDTDSEPLLCHYPVKVRPVHPMCGNLGSGRHVKIWSKFMDIGGRYYKGETDMFVSNFMCWIWASILVFVRIADFSAFDVV